MMKVYCFVESPNGFLDEYCFENYEEFCKTRDMNPDFKFGKPRFDTKSILYESEE